MHGKTTVTKRPSQLFFWKKMTLNWQCSFQRCWVPCSPADLSGCWVGPAAWNSAPRSAEQSLPKQGLEMTCPRLKSELGSRDRSPELWCPWSVVEAFTPKEGEPQRCQLRFHTGCRSLCGAEKMILYAKKRETVPIHPNYTYNHGQPLVFCLLLLHSTHIHRNSSQYYLCNVYSNKVCNPLKYKRFPYNPHTCKSLQIFHTFLSHQQEIVLTPSTGTWIFRNACPTLTTSAPQYCPPLTISSWDADVLPFPRECFQQQFQNWNILNIHQIYIPEKGMYWLLRSQGSFAASSIRLDFQCCSGKSWRAVSA